MHECEPNNGCYTEPLALQMAKYNSLLYLSLKKTHTHLYRKVTNGATNTHAKTPLFVSKAYPAVCRHLTVIAPTERVSPSFTVTVAP